MERCQSPPTRRMTNPERLKAENALKQRQRRKALKRGGGMMVTIELTTEAAIKLAAIRAGRSKAATLTDLINRA